MKLFYQFLYSLVLLIFLNACAGDKEIELKQGLIISQSVTIKKDTFYLDGADSISKPVIIIEGDDIVVDFNGAVLIGSKEYSQPHTFSGLGIEIRNGKNIEIKNARVRGFKIGLMATGIDSLKIVDSDFSYNYRQKLKSTWKKEHLDDWMSYHHNDKDEWLRYGMAVYLKSCDYALVKGLKVTSGQNGLMLTNCSQGLFYNNNISYNSGIGIGLYRSSKNQIKHNILDWNIRGYSFGNYNRGQDSAGILLYEQCNDNEVAFNSATHSGDGFFLWAGQTTMDSGEGGCNNNLVYKNNFSYASNNGIEVTFSGNNKFIENKLWACDYGLWGGYSYGMVIDENFFKDNNHSIAIEHGNNNKIRFNQMNNDKIGVKLFERSKQPESWAFAKKRNVQSRSYTIDGNSFLDMDTPFKIEKTDSILIRYNTFYGSDATSIKKNPNVIYVENESLPLKGGKLSDNENKKKAWIKMKDSYLWDLPKPIDDGLNPDLSLREKFLVGREYIIMGEYGPYNFEYPALWLRNIEGETYTFAVFGPNGNWKGVGGKGFKMMSQKQGTIPATIVLEAESDATELLVELEYIGPAFKDEFGNHYEKGQPVKLKWSKGPQ